MLLGPVPPVEVRFVDTRVELLVARVPLAVARFLDVVMLRARGGSLLGHDLVHTLAAQVRARGQLASGAAPSVFSPLAVVATQGQAQASASTW